MITVFAGPSISHAEAQALLPQARILPPARTGDILKALDDGASAIGLIDGYFEGVPSVWHKEILWALGQGIPVLGGSSMGALRAAELHAFGMVGIGAIFEAYRDGTYEDDDEVALRHGPAELGYMPLSVPMANIRATLAAAVDAGATDENTARALIDAAKARHFPDRTWDGVLADAALAAWIKDNSVDQKRADAVALLGAIAQATAPKTDFAFQHTVMWEALTREVRNAPPDVETKLILDLIRRDPDDYLILRRAASERLGGTPPTVLEEEVTRALTAFRSDHGLYTQAAFDGWLADHNTDLQTLTDMLANDLSIGAKIAQNRAAFHAAMLRTLRAEGRLEALQTQAAQMAQTLRDAGHPDPQGPDIDLPASHLTDWFFRTILQRATPADPQAMAASLDLPEPAQFQEMMARAFILWHELGTET